MTQFLLPILSLLLITASAQATPQVLIDTDFSLPGKAFADINAANSNRITGALPEGWWDNTGWKKNVVAEYKSLTEAGRSFLRITQTSGDGLQFTHDLPGIEKENGYYRLMLTTRSLTGGSLGVRFAGAPYTTVWSGSPAIDGQWRNFSYDFRVAPQSQSLGLFFYLSGNGVLDLQKLKLVKLTDADLIAEIKTRYPDAGQGNLINISRFPMGLQSGWSIDRDFSDGDQVQVNSDTNVLGPSGCPALRINALSGIRIYSVPFAVPWSFEPHVVSLSVRGNWDGKLIVTGGKDQVCAQQPLKAHTADWQRVELTFQPILLSPSHSLRIEGKGTLWLDGLQVEHATKATAYAPQKPLEVSLALPGTDTSSARVQFADEPPKINYCLAGKSPGALLKTRLVTMYGDQKGLPPVKLDGDFLTSGTLTYEPFQSHPLGPYRLEAWVEDTAGKTLSTTNEVVFYRLHRPRYWGKDAPDSFFGTHTLSTTRHLTMAKAVGCNWVRLHDAGTEYIGWSYLEPAKGNWQFRDADLQRYRDHHLKILGLLSTSPGWASNLGKPCTDYFDRYLEPLNMDDWANAVRTIVAHHRNLIDAYEIWNEPWGSSFWSLKFDEKHGTDWRDHFVPSTTPATDYARLQKTAYAAAHEVLPKVTILGFNTYGDENGTKWTREVMEGGGLDVCDAISYHHYENALTGMPGDAVEKAHQAALKPILERYQPVPKPVWMSEGAPLSGDPSNGFYHYTLPYANTDDNWRIADRLARYVISHRATGEKHEFLYTMHGHSTFGGAMDWSTLITADGYLHPSAAAHSACAWYLEDTAFVKHVTLADGVFATLFSGPERAVAAITTAVSHSPYVLPKMGVQCFDLFGNPMALGTAGDDHVHYVVSQAGLAKLQAALGIK